MSKKIMSLIAIVITLITVFIMIYNSQNELNQNYNEKDINEYSVTKKQSNINAKSNKKNETSKNINTNNIQNNITNNSNEQEKNNNNSNSNINNTNNTNNSNGTTDDAANNKVGIITENNSSSKGSGDNEDSVKVFKVSKKDIINELSFSDKLKLMSISKTLSPDDFNSLQDDISSSNERKGVSKAMSLLKRRLDESDFSKIKFIASKYINLKAIDY
ncbi:MAG: hypothetical protein PHX70_01710 [Clostridium sp.]|nr:hypothetical protein [Clostridium sp.]